LYATYAWTAVPFLSTLQAVRFYVPALGAISLLGAWLLVRVPRKLLLAAITTFAVAAALFWLGGWAFHDMFRDVDEAVMLTIRFPTISAAAVPASPVRALARSGSTAQAAGETCARGRGKMGQCPLRRLSRFALNLSRFGSTRG
jgi:hypothetical protein